MILEQLPEVKRWPAAMKVQLAAELWDEALTHEADIPVTPAQTAEIERSMAEFERGANATTTWEAVKARILASRRRE